MEDPGDPHFKRERTGGHTHHTAMHMPAGDTQHPHSFHHPAPQSSQMQQQWAPAPSPYGDGIDQRPPDHGPSHQQQQPPPLPPPPPPPPQQQQQHHHHPHPQPPSQHQPPPAPYAPQGYPPHTAHSQAPVYSSDPSYTRQNSVPGLARSPTVHNSHYPPHPMNGGPHPPPQPHQTTPSQPPPPPANSEAYYSRPEYSRQQYPPSESPVSVPPPTPLHVQTTAHEMMPAQPQSQGPPSAYPPPHSSVPATPHGYWAPPQADWYTQARRKPVRAAQACDNCRQRKAKCDEGRPDCSHCRENNMRCTYRDVPPQKQEKQMLQISDKVETLSEEVKSQNEKLNSQGQQLNDIQTLLQSLVDKQSLDSRHTAAPVSDHGGNGSISFPMTKSRSSRLHNREDMNYEVHAGINTHKDINGSFMNTASTSTPTRNNMPTGETAQTPSKLERGVGAPVGASELLMWPSIRELVPKDIPTTYLMDIEVNRGLIRLYGCGEGEDRHDGHDGAPSPAPSVSSGRMDEDASTASPSGVWGTGQLPQREGTHQPIYDHPGGVTPTGQLLLDCTAVDTYVRSYLERMHILHPFLDTRVLRKMVNAFKAKHSWDYPSIGRMAPSVAVGTKRKREMSDSPGANNDDPSLYNPPHHNGLRHPPVRHTQIEHSVSNAIILLVIALGKICAHETTLPAPPKSNSKRSNSRIVRQQPELGYGDLPPVQPPPSSAPASPFNHYTNGVAAASPTSNVMHGRNIDVIPGLAYFAKAADILGELPGGVDVSHVQANLLAGLYMGQLARVIPSHWYITTACRACQLLIRSAEYLEKRMPQQRRNLVNFAFWSCLQLESDILAEMNIPSSGIVAKEASMIMEVPNSLTLTDDGKDDTLAPKALRHYSNQIQLRRTLNDAVVFIYDTDREGQKPSRLIETLGTNLEKWRELLNDWDWNDAEHQTDDILAARMRAKYYGAKYIISRPALQYALLVSQTESGTPLSRPSESPIANSAATDTTSPAMTHQPLSQGGRQLSGMGPPTSLRHQQQFPPLDKYIIEACKTCVEAAIRSTTAFDSVPNRLVTTNILGTAHAQFGNVLVLAATYNSKNLTVSQFISGEMLEHLFDRTIRFLDDKANISPTLAKDAEILRHVRSKIDFKRPVTGIASANSSFSSHY